MKRLANAGLALLVFAILLFGQSVFPPAGGGGGATKCADLSDDGTGCTADISLYAKLVSPSFTTPALGTPSSGVATNITGLPLTGLVNAPTVRNTYANIVSAGCSAALTGQVSYATDNPMLAHCNGSTLAWFLPGFTSLTPAGACADWSIAYNTGASWTCTDGSGEFLVKITGTTVNIRGIQKATSGSSYSKTACIRPATSLPTTNSMAVGLGWTDGTKYEGIVVQKTNSTDAFIVVMKGTSTTNITSATPGVSTVSLSTTICFRIGESGGNMLLDYSSDGNLWINLLTEATGTFLTPTTYGPLAQISQNTGSAYASALVIGLN